jgi:tRNA(Ile)-lysidine synthase
MNSLDFHLPAATRYWVGFSGGADSTALLLALWRRGLPVTAVHFDHGLRAESGADAAWCRGFCAERGIPFILQELAVPSSRHPGESIETAARRCRLQAWSKLVPPGDAVVLAHHLDDALEELFLRLGRGSNLSGLNPLRPVRELHGVTFLRPFLAFRKTELESWLQDQGIAAWRTDASNTDDRMRRNAVRNRLLPLFREIFGHDRGLVRSLETVQEDAEFLEDEAARRVPDGAEPATAALAELPAALLPRVMRLWLRRETGEDTILGGQDLERLRGCLAAPEGPMPVKLPLSGGLTLRFHRGRFRLLRESASVVPRIWDWRVQPRLDLPEINAAFTAEIIEVTAATDLSPRFTAFFDLAGMPPRLTVRPRREGDELAPIGRSTPEKLKRLFIEAEIPQEQRAGVPVLETDGVILWVPGVRRSNVAPALPGQSAVKIAWVKQ